ncbi:hypothetical protein GCM10023193_01350 [Planotetraspora kaengkrachanensis]|uniref:Uncharacterized protein n=1 Tax=Planotetraspora kaengkrachanensis TaxID=575193 RepID=A0A8J3PPQ1_9ACTN|nr:hypothetical protein Pka01_04240 [Planotetraspora kaengkrachanensis]
MTRSAEMPNPKVRDIIGAPKVVSHTTVAVHELLVLAPGRVPDACQIERRSVGTHGDSTSAELHLLFPSSEHVDH